MLDNEFTKQALDLIIIDEYYARYPLAGYLLTAGAFIILVISLL